MQSFNYKKHIVRLGLSILMLCILFFWMVVLPEFRQLGQQKQQTRLLGNKLQHGVVKPIVHPVNGIQTHDVISDVMRTAQQHQVSMESIRMKPDDQQSFSVVVTADFPTLLCFIELLGTMSILLSDFSLHVVHDSVVTMNASLSFYPGASPPLGMSHFNNKLVNNPMKQEGVRFTLSDHVDKVFAFDDVSVTQLQFAGSLVEKGCIQGLLRSSAGKIGVIVNGMSIGLEKAKVIKVSESEVWLQIPRERGVIHLRSSLLS